MLSLVLGRMNCNRFIVLLPLGPSKKHPEQKRRQEEDHDACRNPDLIRNLFDAPDCPKEEHRTQARPHQQESNTTQAFLNFWLSRHDVSIAQAFAFLRADRLTS